MQTDLSILRSKVLEAAQKSPVAAQVEDIVLESDRDGDGTDFLRVIVQMKNIERAEEADLEALLEAIEGVVGAIDERYPSVRFADAA